jgi:hypothetical protein
MPNHPLGRSGLLVVTGLLLVAGCADPAGGPTAAVPTGAAARACLDVTGGAPWHGLRRVDGARVTVDAYDDYFSPGCLVVPAGVAVTVVLTDRGHLPHTLEGAGSPDTVSVDAGQTAFWTIPAVQRPTRLVCGLHEDEDMVLAVVPAAEGGNGV